ncbi:MAG: DUF2201 family putative metallopeptidase [Planctomycetaceae bacterium]
MARRNTPPPQHVEAIKAGWNMVQAHPLYGGLMSGPGGLVRLWPGAAAPFAVGGWVRIVVDEWPASAAAARWPGDHASLVANAWQRGSAEEWAHVLAQAVLHVALNHVDPCRDDAAWRRACEWEAVRFLRSMPVGRRPEGLWSPTVEPQGQDPESIARWFAMQGDESLSAAAGLAGHGAPAWVHRPGAAPFDDHRRRLATASLAAALRTAVTAAVEEAGTRGRGPASPRRDPNSLAERARSWFVTNYPLLAALAAAFDIIEDEALCHREAIAIAAVDSEARRVFVNPRAPWTWETMQFVIAHEPLHVGLRHEARRQGRDPFLWNVACDYVINGWLVRMGIGTMPAGCLLDVDAGLDRESAEALYDRIAGEVRLRRRLLKARTFRGQGVGDLLGERSPGWWTGAGCDLDEFYRRALADGLDLHLRRCQGRGLLPGDLIEEIHALRQRPIPWDVALGRWLDDFFPPLERRRSYARASRRQSATPDIPRPVWERPWERTAQRTFGVVLDTSGSMGPRDLGRGLGAIAAYALGRDVAVVRVVQCDAGIHDMGYVEPDRLVGTVEIRGRGGTVLSPAIRHLERADDFPADAPILVITDGACDVLTIGRPHAFLMPAGARLPFATRAPRFAFETEVTTR